MQFVQDASSEPYLEFSKIREGIYDAPSDFIIKAGSLYEPFDDQLLRECGGPSISFPLARVYEALQKSDQGCDHIWALFELLFSVSRDTDIRTLCEVMPGVYQVPQDVVVVRMHRSPAVGGISYRLISREWHSECQRLFALPRRTQELMLAEIYGGLWIRHERENQTPILLEMKAMMQDWLQDTAFPNTEEGMLTRLVLKLGTYVHSQVIANFTRAVVRLGMYKLTQVKRYGMVKGEIHWSAMFQLQRYPDVWRMPTGTVEELVNVTSYGVEID